MDLHLENRDVLFEDVFAHLGEVKDHPETTTLDEDLLKRAERSLEAGTRPQLLWRILQTGEQLLQILQQDPRPLTRLLERTVQFIPFDELKTSISPGKLQEGLDSLSVPIQLLCLAYLTKAADQPSGAAFVASNSSLVQGLLNVWLAIESTEVSERALETIVALLAVDSPQTVTVVAADNATGEAYGQGLMWRRVFHDAEVYSLLFLWTSLRRSNHDLKTKKGQQAVTVSQARLLDFIARVAQLDWSTITTSTMPNLETNFMTDTADGLTQPYGGLLRYAASGMIDPSDYLMEILRRDFFLRLLTVVGEQNGEQVSPRLLSALQAYAGVDGVSNESNGMHL